MGPRPFAPSPKQAAILVVDDDRRVVELLTIALTAYGYRVLSAGDGDEALKVAMSERPDLVVLDVRLPKKSGLEVCEVLRQDPEDPHVPIIMVSAAAEIEARLQGLSRGADDYVAKPFSPKELMARIKRLLARSAESREAVRRGLEAERELNHVREEAKRNHAELLHEQKLRDLTLYLARDLHRVLDVDDLVHRLVLRVHAHAGVSVTAILCLERPGGPLTPFAIHGDVTARIADLELATGGELAALLHGLGRPVRRQELERFPELQGELPPFIAAGLTLLAPLCGPSGLEGLLVLDERVDGQDLTRHDSEVLTAFCDIAALALHNAQRCRAQANGLLEMLASLAGTERVGLEVDALAEAAELVRRAAAPALPLRERELLLRAIALGEWVVTAHGRQALDAAASQDPSGRLAELLRMTQQAADMTGPAARGRFEDHGDSVDEQLAAMLLAFALAYARERMQGSDAEQALARSVEHAGSGLDEMTQRSLERELRERPALADSERLG